MDTQHPTRQTVGNAASACIAFVLLHSRCHYSLHIMAVLIIGQHNKIVKKVSSLMIFCLFVTYAFNSTTILLFNHEFRIVRCLRHSKLFDILVKMCLL